MTMDNYQMVMVTMSITSYGPADLYQSVICRIQNARILNKQII